MTAATPTVPTRTGLIAAAIEAADAIEARRLREITDREEDQLRQTREDAARAAANILDLGAGALIDPHSWYPTWTDWGQTDATEGIVYGLHDEGMLFRFRVRGDDGNFGAHLEVAVQVEPGRVRRHVEDPDCGGYPPPVLDWCRIQTLAELGVKLRDHDQHVLLVPPPLPDTVEATRIVTNALVGHAGIVRCDIGPDDADVDDAISADRRRFTVDIDGDGALVLRVRNPRGPGRRSFILRAEEEVTR